MIDYPQLPFSRLIQSLKAVGLAGVCALLIGWIGQPVTAQVTATPVPVIPRPTLVPRVTLTPRATLTLLSGTPTRTAAPTTPPPEVTIRFESTTIRQGQVGIVSATGRDLISGNVRVFDRNYPCYPTTTGVACLIAVPITQPIQTYSALARIQRSDGQTFERNSPLTAGNGGFATEIFTLPASLNYLLRDDVQANEDDRLLSAYNMITPNRYWEGSFVQPINSPVVSAFGVIRNYTNNGATRRHTGVDLVASMGTPVLAAASGRVALSRPMDIHGNNVVIDHGWGVYTEYAHLSDRYVLPGQLVLQGDVLGLSGNTGRSTGPHLHWEVAVAGVWVNPVLFLQVKLPQ
jgi:murein DD-endopeptidase MepM/ murein hydrolase activator NlpD